MAQFDQAYKITMVNEGGYSNNPNDHGGETWRGIARNFWGNWIGWKLIDSIKSTHPASLSKALAANQQLEVLVLDFYKKNFWDCLCLDNISCQQIGDQLFDIAVNMGTGTAAKFLQTAINAFANNALTVDGQVGPRTIEAANKLSMEPLYDKINEIRKKHYESLIAANPSQAEFKNSWFSRIKPFETTAAGNVA
ncbi:MAG: hypothetical protein M3040_14615 [Bacteroidota bacterium]|nr:hypothetical protein [Bacteroidota bacterium]